MTRRRHLPNAEVPSFTSIRTRRRLVLVDIENAIGAGRISPGQTSSIRPKIMQAICCTDLDQVVVGISHINFLEVMTEWPRVRVVVQSGPDGADKALLSVLDESVAERFSGLVVVSGDHIFSSAVASIDLRTEVVSSRSSLANSLRLAADRVVYLPERSPDAA